MAHHYDARDAWSGTTTPGEAEVITLGRVNAVRIVRVAGSGHLWFALNPQGDDIDITAPGRPGLRRIPNGAMGSRLVMGKQNESARVVLKSDGAVEYTVERA